MDEHQFRHLPVVSRGNQHSSVLGVVSMKDLVRSFLSYHEAQLSYLQSYINLPVW